MKGILKTTMAVFAIVASTGLSALASDGIRIIKVDPVSETVYQLTYLKQKDVNVLVSITDANGRKLFAESLKNNKSFTKSYSFEGLPSGSYTFNIEDELGLVTKTVSYKSAKYEKSELIASIEKASDEKAKVVVRGEKMEPVLVNIYDKFNNLVFDDYITNDKSFSKVYDFSKMRSNDLVIEVSSQGEVLAKTKF